VDKKFWLIIILVWLALLVAVGSRGQGVFITVTDNKAREPVPFAHVRFDGLKSGNTHYSLTSDKGQVQNDAKEKTKITVSYMGYATCIDTIRPGQSLEIRMKPNVLNMDEVVVTAQYTPQRIDKSIYPVEVINSREIELKAATNMSDLLKNEVNMRVSNDGVLGSSLSMQGMSGQNVKFLMDGIPVIGRMNGNINLNEINLFNVDHVEVIEGPMSVIYGSNALAGVINIITKENKTSAFNATGNIYAESVGVFNFDAAVSANVKKNGFSADGGRNFFGGYSYNGTSRQQDFLPDRQYFFDAYYTYTEPNFKVKASGQYFNDLLIYKGPLLPQYYETAFDNYYTTVRYSARAEASVKLPRSLFLDLLGSYSSYERTKKTYYKDLTTLSQEVSTNPEDRDTTGITSWTGRATIARNNAGSKFNYQAGADLSLESMSGKRTLGHYQQQGDYAGFVSLKYDPLAVLSFQPGMRLIYNTKYAAPVVYALSARWNIVKPLVLRFSFSRGFRAPDLKEQFLVFKDVNHDIVGNPDLKAETSFNYNLDLAYSSENKTNAWSANLSAFYNDIDNNITLAQSGNIYTYYNLAKFRTLGVQLGGAFRLYPWLTLEAGFSETGRYSSLEVIETDPTRFYYSPDVNTNIIYRIVKPGLTFSVFYKYTGKMPQVFVDSKGTMTEGYIGAFNMMDLTATKSFLENDIVLSAGVKNLFNVTTIPAVGGSGGVHGGGGGDLSTSWGRTFFVKLSLSFNKLK
jgi:outer membrane receptor for ferrienterochelin and colicins